MHKNIYYSIWHTKKVRNIIFSPLKKRLPLYSFAFSAPFLFACVYTRTRRHKHSVTNIHVPPPLESVNEQQADDCLPVFYIFIHTFFLLVSFHSRSIVVVTFLNEPPPPLFGAPAVCKTSTPNKYIGRETDISQSNNMENG